MSARLTITLSRTSVWLLFLACLFAIPAYADRYDRGADQRGFHWRDILRDAARDEVREYRTPQWRSSDGIREYRRVEPRQSYRGEEERRAYRGDEPRDRYDGWREQRADRWAERERQAELARQQREEAAAREQQEQEAERARQEEEQRRHAAVERERQVLLEQQQREEAAARERDELARQRLIAQQQEEQRAAEQARLERERQESAQRAYQQEQERRELIRLSRLWAERLLWLGLAAGVLALLVPAYRYWLEGRASAESLGAVVGGKKLLSLLCLAGFSWASSLGTASPERDLLILALALAGLPGAFFLAGIGLLVFEYLHYVFVPHPVERSVKKMLMTRDLRPEDFEDVTRRLYDSERNGLLPAWRFRNLRQRIEEMQKLVEREDRLLGGLGEHVKKRAQARR